MSSLNKVMIIGNLGKDPEMKFLPNGNAICNFSIATKEKWKNATGTQQDKTEWHKIVVFGKLAEVCGEYLKKGKQVYVEGKIQTRSWDGRDGNKMYTTEIVVNQMTILGSNDNQQNANNSSSSAPQMDDDDDSLPF